MAASDEDDCEEGMRNKNSQDDDDKNMDMFETISGWLHETVSAQYDMQLASVRRSWTMLADRLQHHQSPPSTVTAERLEPLVSRSASVVLSTQWNGVSIDTRDSLVSQVQCIIDLLDNIVDASSAPAEAGVLCRSLVAVCRAPWQHDTLKRLIARHTVTLPQVLSYCCDEGVVVLSARLQVMCESRCEDMALAVVQQCVRCMELDDDDSFSRLCSDNQRHFFFDLHLCLLFKFKHKNDIVLRLRRLSEQQWCVVAARFCRRAASGGAACGGAASRCWRHVQRTCMFVCQSLVSVCLAEVGCSVVSELVGMWADLVKRDQLSSCNKLDPEQLGKLVRQLVVTASRTGSATAAVVNSCAQAADNLSLLAVLIVEHFGGGLCAVAVELCVLALTRQCNRLQQCLSSCSGVDNKHSSSHPPRAPATSKTGDLSCDQWRHLLAVGFMRLAELTSGVRAVSRECVLTAFSLRPDAATLRSLARFVDDGESADVCPPCEHNVDDAQDSDAAAFSACAQQLMQQLTLESGGVAAVPYDALADECAAAVTRGQQTGEVLDVPAELVADLLSVLNAGRRWKVLSWRRPWRQLLSLCRAYLSRGADALINVTTDLKHVHLDYSRFDDNVSDDDEEADVYADIERGYERYVDFDGKDASSPPPLSSSTTMAAAVVLGTAIVEMKEEPDLKLDVVGQLPGRRRTSVAGKRLSSSSSDEAQWLGGVGDRALSELMPLPNCATATRTRRNNSARSRRSSLCRRVEGKRVTVTTTERARAVRQSGDADSTGADSARCSAPRRRPVGRPRGSGCAPSAAAAVPAALSASAWSQKLSALRRVMQQRAAAAVASYASSLSSVAQRSSHAQQQQQQCASTWSTVVPCCYGGPPARPSVVASVLPSRASAPTVATSTAAGQSGQQLSGRKGSCSPCVEVSSDVAVSLAGCGGRVDEWRDLSWSHSNLLAKYPRLTITPSPPPPPELASDGRCSPSLYHRLSDAQVKLCDIKECQGLRGLNSTAPAGVATAPCSPSQLLSRLPKCIHVYPMLQQISEQPHHVAAYPVHHTPGQLFGASTVPASAAGAADSAQTHNQSQPPSQQQQGSTGSAFGSLARVQSAAPETASTAPLRSSTDTALSASQGLTRGRTTLSYNNSIVGAAGCAASAGSRAAKRMRTSSGSAVCDPAGGGGGARCSISVQEVLRRVQLENAHSPAVRSSATTAAVPVESVAAMTARSGLRHANTTATAAASASDVGGTAVTRRTSVADVQVSDSSFDLGAATSGETAAVSAVPSGSVILNKLLECGSTSRQQLSRRSPAQVPSSLSRATPVAQYRPLSSTQVVSSGGGGGEGDVNSTSFTVSSSALSQLLDDGVDDCGASGEGSGGGGAADNETITLYRSHDTSVSQTFVAPAGLTQHLLTRQPPPQVPAVKQVVIPAVLQQQQPQQPLARLSASPRSADSSPAAAAGATNSTLAGLLSTVGETGAICTASSVIQPTVPPPAITRTSGSQTDYSDHEVTAPLPGGSLTSVSSLGAGQSSVAGVSSAVKSQQGRCVSTDGDSATRPAPSRSGQLLTPAASATTGGGSGVSQLSQILSRPLDTSGQRHVKSRQLASLLSPSAGGSHVAAVCRAVTSPSCASLSSSTVTPAVGAAQNVSSSDEGLVGRIADYLMRSGGSSTATTTAATTTITTTNTCTRASASSSAAEGAVAASSSSQIHRQQSIGVYQTAAVSVASSAPATSVSATVAGTISSSTVATLSARTMTAKLTTGDGSTSGSGSSGSHPVMHTGQVLVLNNQQKVLPQNILLHGQQYTLVTRDHQMIYLPTRLMQQQQQQQALAKQRHNSSNTAATTASSTGTTSSGGGGAATATVVFQRGGQAATNANVSSTTLEQLREFESVLEAVSTRGASGGSGTAGELDTLVSSELLGLSNAGSVGASSSGSTGTGRQLNSTTNNSSSSSFLSPTSVPSNGAVATGVLTSSHQTAASSSTKRATVGLSNFMVATDKLAQRSTSAGAMPLNDCGGRVKSKHSTISTASSPNAVQTPAVQPQQQQLVKMKGSCGGSSSSSSSSSATTSPAASASTGGGMGASIKSKPLVSPATLVKTSPVKQELEDDETRQRIAAILQQYQQDLACNPTPTPAPRNRKNPPVYTSRGGGGPASNMCAHSGAAAGGAATSGAVCEQSVSAGGGGVGGGGTCKTKKKPSPIKKSELATSVAVSTTTVGGSSISPVVCTAQSQQMTTSSCVNVTASNSANSSSIDDEDSPASAIKFRRSPSPHSAAGFSSASAATACQSASSSGSQGTAAVTSSVSTDPATVDSKPINTVFSRDNHVTTDNAGPVVASSSQHQHHQQQQQFRTLRVVRLVAPMGQHSQLLHSLSAVAAAAATGAVSTASSGGAAVTTSPSLPATATAAMSSLGVVHMNAANTASRAPVTSSICLSSTAAPAAATTSSVDSLLLPSFHTLSSDAAASAVSSVAVDAVDGDPSTTTSPPSGWQSLGGVKQHPSIDEQLFPGLVKEEPMDDAFGHSPLPVCGSTHHVDDVKMESCDHLDGGSSAPAVTAFNSLNNSRPPENNGEDVHIQQASFFTEQLQSCLSSAGGGGGAGGPEHHAGTQRSPLASDRRRQQPGSVSEGDNVDASNDNGGSVALSGSRHHVRLHSTISGPQQPARQSIFHYHQQPSTESMLLEPCHDPLVVDQVGVDGSGGSDSGSGPPTPLLSQSSVHVITGVLSAATATDGAATGAATDPPTVDTDPLIYRVHVVHSQPMLALLASDRWRPSVGDKCACVWCTMCDPCRPVAAGALRKWLSGCRGACVVEHECCDRWTFQPAVDVSPYGRSADVLTNVTGAAVKSDAAAEKPDNCDSGMESDTLAGEAVVWPDSGGSGGLSVETSSLNVKRRRRRRHRRRQTFNTSCHHSSVDDDTAECCRASDYQLACAVARRRREGTRKPKCICDESTNDDSDSRTGRDSLVSRAVAATAGVMRPRGDSPSLSRAISCSFEPVICLVPVDSSRFGSAEGRAGRRCMFSGVLPQYRSIPSPSSPVSEWSFGTSVTSSRASLLSSVQQVSSASSECAPCRRRRRRTRRHSSPLAFSWCERRASRRVSRPPICPCCSERATPRRRRRRLASPPLARSRVVMPRLVLVRCDRLLLVECFVRVSEVRVTATAAAVLVDSHVERQPIVYAPRLLQLRAASSSGNSSVCDAPSPLTASNSSAVVVAARGASGPARAAMNGSSVTRATQHRGRGRPRSSETLPRRVTRSLRNVTRATLSGGLDGSSRPRRRI